MRWVARTKRSIFHFSNEMKNIKKLCAAHSGTHKMSIIPTFLQRLCLIIIILMDNEHKESDHEQLSIIFQTNFYQVFYILTWFLLKRCLKQDRSGSETRPFSFGIIVSNRITVELKRKTLPWPDSVISFFHLNIFLSKCRFHHFGFFTLSYLCYKSLSHRAESWHHFSLLSI